jgi:hypothetical protein
MADRKTLDELPSQTAMATGDKMHLRRSGFDYRIAYEDFVSSLPVPWKNRTHVQTVVWIATVPPSLMTLPPTVTQGAAYSPFSITHTPQTATIGILLAIQVTQGFGSQNMGVAVFEGSNLITYAVEQVAGNNMVLMTLYDTYTVTPSTLYNFSVRVGTLGSTTAIAVNGQTTGTTTPLVSQFTIFDLI